MIAEEAYVLSKSFTNNSLKGITGALAGKNCTIKSATKADGVTTVVFAWTADDGTEKTTTIQVNDGAKGGIGIGIDNVTINANSHLIVTLSDGSTIDAGLIQGGSGTDDYEDLINRPKIEGVDLIGNKTFEDLGVASATDLAQTDGHLQDLADLVGDKANLPMPNETVVNNIEYVDTKVDGLIDDNVTGLTKTFSSDKITKTFATLEEVNESLSVIGKCKNLLNPTLQITTQNGVTCTNNGDGTYTLNGTATGTVFFFIQSIVDFAKKTTNKDYKLVGCPANGANSKYDLRYEINGSVNNGGNKDFGKGCIVKNDKINSADIISADIIISIMKGFTVNNLVFKPMITTNLDATYDDFVPYTGDGDTLAADVAEIKNDLGGLSFSASGTTLTITDGTNTWTLEANR